MAVQEEIVRPRMLDVRHVSKAFPGVRALRDVSLTFKEGHVHALVGENGAGKSTLMKILSGAYRPDSGRIALDGRDIAPGNPVESRRRGISTIYQEFYLAPDLTIAQNIFLGQEPRRGKGLALSQGTMIRRAADVLERLGMPIDPRRRAAGLSVAQQQVVEIAKALVRETRVLIMDEPTAALSHEETARLLEIVAALRTDGKVIIFISHRLPEIFRIADAVSVLKDGAVVGTWPIGEIDEAQLIVHMVGRTLGNAFPTRSTGSGPVLLEVRGLSNPGSFTDVGFAVCAGEIVGLAGLEGQGQHELARALFGLEGRVGGMARIGDRAGLPRGPRAAIRAGLVYLSDDRKGEELALPLPVRHNLSLSALARWTRGGLIDHRRERLETSRLIADLHVRTTPRGKQPVGELSGGNQQKVVVGKRLATRPRVLIFDEPTRGVDVGAKLEIYTIMRDLAERGAAIVILSRDMLEIIGLCDRVLVVAGGRVTKELSGPAITEQAIMEAAIPRDTRGTEGGSMEDESRSRLGIGAGAPRRRGD